MATRSEPKVATLGAAAKPRSSWQRRPRGRRPKAVLVRAVDPARATLEGRVYRVSPDGTGTPVGARARPACASTRRAAARLCLTVARSGVDFRGLVLDGNGAHAPHADPHRPAEPRARVAQRAHRRDDRPSSAATPTPRRAPSRPAPTLIDLASGRTIADLEKFTVTKDGQRIHSPGLQLLGRHLRARQRRVLRDAGHGRAPLPRPRQRPRDAPMTVIHDNVECPSLSPDGTRIAYKRRDGNPWHWRLHVLDLTDRGRRRRRRAPPDRRPGRVAGQPARCSTASAWTSGPPPPTAAAARSASWPTRRRPPRSAETWPSRSSRASNASYQPLVERDGCQGRHPRFRHRHGEPHPVRSEGGGVARAGGQPADPLPRAGGDARGGHRRRRDRLVPRDRGRHPRSGGRRRGVGARADPPAWPTAAARRPRCMPRRPSSRTARSSCSAATGCWATRCPPSPGCSTRSAPTSACSSTASSRAGARRARGPAPAARGRRARRPGHDRRRRRLPLRRRGAARRAQGARQRPRRHGAGGHRRARPAGRRPRPRAPGARLAALHRRRPGPAGDEPHRPRRAQPRGRRDQRGRQPHLRARRDPPDRAPGVQRDPRAGRSSARARASSTPTSARTPRSATASASRAPRSSTRSSSPARASSTSAGASRPASWAATRKVYRDFALPRALRLQVGDGVEVALC